MLEDADEDDDTDSKDGEELNVLENGWSSFFHLIWGGGNPPASHIKVTGPPLTTSTSTGSRNQKGATVKKRLNNV